MSVAHGPLHLELLHGIVLVRLVLVLLGAHLGEHVGGLGGVLAPHADLVTIAVEEEGEGHTRDSQERRERAGPVDAQVVVHVGGEEGERGAKERTQDRVGSKNGGGEDDV